MSGVEAFHQANNLFVDESFEEALAKYSEAINLESNNVEYYLKRSACHLKLKNYTDSLSDANEVIKLAPNNAQGYLKKGIALFQLEEYESAKTAFEKGQTIEYLEAFKTWIRKCNAELHTESSENLTTPMESEPTENPAQIQSVPAPSSQIPSQESSLPPPKKPLFKHDWYQSHTHVIITVLAKNISKEETTVEILEKEFNLAIKLPENKEYQINLNLCDKIIPTESTVNHLSTKIEIKLRKASPVQWATLEATGDSVVRPWADTSNVDKHVYPSSSHKKKNWDEIAASVPEVKLEGEEGLNKVFQDIYQKGSEDQRRAMMKSFVESGGTVLSTNWDDVGKRYVEGSPPKGLEMKKW